MAEWGCFVRERRLVLSTAPFGFKPGRVWVEIVHDPPEKPSVKSFRMTAFRMLQVMKGQRG